MKISRFSDAQIIAILKQAESGSPVPELCLDNNLYVRHKSKKRAISYEFNRMMAALNERVRPVNKGPNGSLRPTKQSIVK
jgi:putative transposase